MIQTLVTIYLTLFTLSIMFLLADRKDFVRTLREIDSYEFGFILFFILICGGIILAFGNIFNKVDNDTEKRK